MHPQSSLNTIKYICLSLASSHAHNTHTHIHNAHKLIPDSFLNFSAALCIYVLYFTVLPTVPLSPRQLTVTREFEDGAELNWLPPTEPNGEVLHYVIYYTPEGGTEQNSSTGSNLTHYNLTGLERNRVYTNITVQAVNSAGRSNRSAVIAQYNRTTPGGYLVYAHAQSNYICISCRYRLRRSVYTHVMHVQNTARITLNLMHMFIIFCRHLPC